MMSLQLSEISMFNIFYLKFKYKYSCRYCENSQFCFDQKGFRAEDFKI